MVRQRSANLSTAGGAVNGGGEKVVEAQFEKDEKKIIAAITVENFYYFSNFRLV